MPVEGRGEGVAARSVEGGQAAQPLVPLSVFRIRSVTASNLLSVATGGVLPATFLFISLFLQEVLGMDPMSAGLAMLPAAAGIVLGSFVAASVVSRLGPRTSFVAGAALCAAALTRFAVLDADGGYLAQVPVPLFLTMLGFGLTGLPLTLAATADAGREHQGLAAGLLNTSRQVGGAVGLAVLVAVAAARTDALAGSTTADRALVGGFATAWAVAAALMAASAAAGLTLPNIVTRKGRTA